MVVYSSRMELVAVKQLSVSNTGDLYPSNKNCPMNDTVILLYSQKTAIYVFFIVVIGWRKSFGS